MKYMKNLKKSPCLKVYPKEREKIIYLKVGTQLLIFREKIPTKKSSLSIFISVAAGLQVHNTQINTNI